MTMFLRSRARSLVTAAGLATAISTLGCGTGDGPNAPPSAPTVPSVDGGGPPNSPSPRAPAGFIWAMVVDQSGGCIPGATIQIMSGPSTGASPIEQDSECSVWGYGGGVMLYYAPGTRVTLRAAAAGYAPQDSTVTAASSGYVTAFVLSPIR